MTRDIAFRFTPPFVAWIASALFANVLTHPVSMLVVVVLTVAVLVLHYPLVARRIDVSLLSAMPLVSALMAVRSAVVRPPEQSSTVLWIGSLILVAMYGLCVMIPGWLTNRRGSPRRDADV